MAIFQMEGENKFLPMVSFGIFHNILPQNLCLDHSGHHDKNLHVKASYWSQKSSKLFNGDKNVPIFQTVGNKNGI